jgi:hypothetical protein
LLEFFLVCRVCEEDAEFVKRPQKALVKDFDFVRRIFHGSEDSKGQKLFWRSEELLESLKNGALLMRLQFAK